MIANLALFIGLFLFFLVCGVHIAVALGVSSIIYLVFLTDFEMSFFANASLAYSNGYALGAIPLFIMAGYIMGRTGLIADLFAFMDCGTSRLPAGMGVGAMFTCMIFAAITGSSVAEASAMAVVAIPEMRKVGYADDFSAGIIACGGSLGMLIPPSLSMIIYGVICSVSIPRLFMAGMLPGIVLGLLLSIVIIIRGHRRGYGGRPMDWRKLRRTAMAAFWALLMPTIVLGGLYGGLFTPTEAGAVAVGYALLYGLGSGRLKFIKELPDILKGSIKPASMVFLILAGAGLFALLLTMEQIPQTIMSAILSAHLTWWMFLILINIILLIMGMFLDGVSMLVISLPIMFPIATALGINPFQLGVILTVNIELAVVTPPVGLNLYAISGISKIPIYEVLRGALPFMLTTLAFLILVSYWPPISLYLPTLVWG